MALVMSVVIGLTNGHDEQPPERVVPVPNWTADYAGPVRYFQLENPDVAIYCHERWEGNDGCGLLASILVDVMSGQYMIVPVEEVP